MVKMLPAEVSLREQTHVHYLSASDRTAIIISPSARSDDTLPQETTDSQTLLIISPPADRAGNVNRVTVMEGWNEGAYLSFSAVLEGSIQAEGSLLEAIVVLNEVSLRPSSPATDVIISHLAVAREAVRSSGNKQVHG